MQLRHFFRKVTKLQYTEGGGRDERTKSNHNLLERKPVVYHKGFRWDGKRIPGSLFGPEGISHAAGSSGRLADHEGWTLTLFKNFREIALSFQSILPDG